MNIRKILLYILCWKITIIFVVLSTSNIAGALNLDNTTVNNYILNNTVLQETDDKGVEYINKIYFVGDSTTYHFHKAGIDKSHILVPENLTLTLSSNINDITVGTKGLTISKAIKEINCEIVIITIGVNGADNFSEIKYKTYYKKLIDEIKESSPNTQIIIQSVFPVTNDFSNKNTGITNNGIDRINEWAKEIAFDEGIKYLDTQSILKDENGAQLNNYSVNDGVHMNAKAYESILYYIRTHALNIKE